MIQRVFLGAWVFFFDGAKKLDERVTCDDVTCRITDLRNDDNERCLPFTS